MYCWGNTVNGELGLGGIEQDHIFSPVEHNFKQAGSVMQGKIKNLFFVSKLL